MESSYVVDIGSLFGSWKGQEIVIYLFLRGATFECYDEKGQNALLFKPRQCTTTGTETIDRYCVEEEL
ncbi:hypothetical protein BLNAU_21190 [Blattamonas nauphoetae]|uniref:Uncharacterized protein n=1 Tax=Blattamonas nauphoetae TaxID=2049346 RepID=A0ABQ9WYT2_9EUKA|nr:hypothetical protein BLNAU_21190 [Blattamonas nauphoetae]